MKAIVLAAAALFFAGQAGAVTYVNGWVSESKVGGFSGKVFAPAPSRDKRVSITFFGHIGHTSQTDQINLDLTGYQLYDWGDVSSPISNLGYIQISGGGSSFTLWGIHPEGITDTFLDLSYSLELKLINETPEVPLPASLFLMLPVVGLFLGKRRSGRRVAKLARA